MSPPPPQYIRTVPRRSVNSHWGFFESGDDTSYRRAGHLHREKKEVRCYARPLPGCSAFVPEPTYRSRVSRFCALQTWGRAAVVAGIAVVLWCCGANDGEG
jgi:hypothetical protein